jgi:CheY-like chemotaxis protein
MGSPKSKKRLLVLDDDSAVRQTWTIILRQHGYDVVAAERGEEAVTAACQHQPDLLLADIRLPDMSGIEAAQRIVQAVPHCRVLLISGDGGSSEVLEDAIARGVVFEVLPKPISPLELLARIGERIGGADCD